MIKPFAECALSMSEMKIICAVARHRNFASAGLSISMTQPAVSYGLRGVEKRNGIILVIRSAGHGPKSSMTEEGAQIARLAGGVLESLKKIKTEELDGVLSILAVLECHGFCAASRQVFCSQGNISRRIKEVEKAVGEVLLVRKKTRQSPIFLTQHGLKLLPLFLDVQRGAREINSILRGYPHNPLNGWRLHD